MSSTIGPSGLSSLFPDVHWNNMVHWTSNKLREISQPEVCPSELLRFLGVIILTTRFQFGSRREPWSRNPTYKCIPAPCFGHAGFSRHRFEYFLNFITFPLTDLSPSISTLSTYRLSHVDVFFTAVNEHRRNLLAHHQAIFASMSRFPLGVVLAERR